MTWDRDAEIIGAERLVNHVVKRLTRLKGGRQLLERSDLVSICRVAVCIAANAYDPAKQIPFRNFAGFVISSEISREFKAARRLKRSGTAREVMESDYMSGGDGMSSMATLACARHAISPEDAAELSWLLGTLSHRERDVIERNHLRGETLKQIGESTGISRQAVHLVEQRAMAKLRAAVTRGEMVA